MQAELANYLAVKARFEAIAAERDIRLAPILNGDVDAPPDDDRDTYIQINTELGYWEAYDALQLAWRGLNSEVQTLVIKQGWHHDH